MTSIKWINNLSKWLEILTSKLEATASSTFRSQFHLEMPFTVIARISGTKYILKLFRQAEKYKPPSTLWWNIRTFDWFKVLKIFLFYFYQSMGCFETHSKLYGTQNSIYLWRNWHTFRSIVLSFIIIIVLVFVRVHLMNASVMTCLTA